jgi:hypothetical protein
VNEMGTGSLLNTPAPTCASAAELAKKHNANTRVFMTCLQPENDQCNQELVASRIATTGVYAIPVPKPVGLICWFAGYRWGSEANSCTIVVDV